jgi:Lon protease-like protein
MRRVTTPESGCMRPPAVSRTNWSGGAAATLPLFPLNTVLFPDGLLPLRIFETRYVDMVGQCMREASPFGVVMIRSGAEVGAVADTAELGTTARIVDFGKLPDGLLGITCRGERKFRVLKRWQRTDGLNLGDIEYLQLEATLGLPDEYRHLADLLRKVLPELGEPYASMAGNFADASWVGGRLAEILPVSLADKLSLLELDEPLERLARLNQLVRRVPA